MKNKRNKFIDLLIFTLIILVIAIIYKKMNNIKLNSNTSNSISISSYIENTVYENVEFENERVISFSFNYKDGQDMLIEIRPQGASRLPNIGSYYLVDKSTENKEKKLYMEMFSDCLMPYKVYANSNSTNSRSEYNQIWTGGWHGAAGDNFELPSSAKNIKFELYVDGKRIEENSNGVINGNEAIIVIENLIDAYNTVDLINGYNGNSRAVLKETQTLTLTDGKISVNTEVEALEDITIKTMYGIAMNVNVVGENTFVKYIGTVNESERLLVVGGEEVYLHNSGVKSENNKCSKVSVTNKYTGDVLEMFLDTSVGLGNFEYISDTTPMAFATNYKKIYYNLVNGKGLKLKKGEMVSFSGGWNIYNKNYKVIN